MKGAERCGNTYSDQCLNTEQAAPEQEQGKDQQDEQAGQGPENAVVFHVLLFLDRFKGWAGKTPANGTKSECQSCRQDFRKINLVSRFRLRVAGSTPCNKSSNITQACWARASVPSMLRSVLI